VIGLNLISEPYVDAASLTMGDFFVSKQKIGVKRGVLRPEPLYFCSPKLYRAIKIQKLKGFGFEIAHVK